MAVPDPPTSGPTEDPLTGRLLVGRYRLNRPIASGGMAEVWEATDETLARRVAVKLLHRHLGNDDSFVQRFRAEAVAAARLAHPSIVSVYDTFSADGMEGIVMELVVGTTMRADLDQHGPMRLEAVLAIGTQVADALGAAHASGLVHRDVKPANILLSADGRVLVADFGIAKAAEGNDLTTAGAMVGTAKYLAPEQVEGGAIDGRADLYSLGVVLYEALTGVAPFVAETDAATALARLHRAPVPPRQIRSTIPPAVEAVVLQAMALRPEERFATAAAMRTALLGAGADPRRAPAAAVAAAAANPRMAPGTPPPAGSTAHPAALQPTPAHLPAPAPSRAPAPAPMPAPPAPLPPPPAAPVTSEQPTPRRSRGWMVVVVVIALAAVAGWFAANREPPETGASGDEIAVSEATTFDPQGGDGENDDAIGNVIDGDPATFWATESYRDPETMAGKDGVGVALTLDGTHDIDQVDVHTAEGGWAAQIYVIEGDLPTDLAGWGSPVASADDADTGLTRFTFDATTGDHVLVWFTRVSASRQVQVSEIEVSGS